MKHIVEGLHDLERKTLRAFQKSPQAHTLDELVALTGLSTVELLRALDWLARKGILLVDKQEQDHLLLDENGKKYHSKGLPQRRFLEVIAKHPLTLEEIKKKAGLDDDEARSSLGTLKGKLAITFIASQAKMTEQGILLLAKQTPEEKFLAKEFPVLLNSLQGEEIYAYDLLKRRKNIIKVEKTTSITAQVTDEGKKLLHEDLTISYLDKVTSDLIKSGEWKEKKFRRYDFSTPPPRFYANRRHPLHAVIEDMRKIWLSMGFEEIAGPWVETAFWCMDSMWIPQDHPARDMQDTFYLPYEGTIPHVLAKKVAQVHEDGGDTGSSGYGYQWNPRLAKQLLLRTHTTAATFRKLGEGVHGPIKCFSVGRIFRNEAIDATHLPEFHQIEGFIMDKDLTLRDLMGYIAEFYRRMGIEKIKFRPTYNPYTEPSMEALGWNEELGRYIELINAGMFRPEALEPYGIKEPVIAWGLGVERLAMMIYKEKNIRNMLGATADLQWLRQYKLPKVML